MRNCWLRIFYFIEIDIPVDVIPTKRRGISRQHVHVCIIRMLHLT